MTSSQFQNNLGMRRHRVVMHSKSVIEGEAGQDSVSYPVISPVWANVQISAENASEVGERLLFSARGTFTVHHAPELRKTRLIIYDGRTFEVQSVRDPDSLKAVLVFEATEIGTPKEMRTAHA